MDVICNAIMGTPWGEISVFFEMRFSGRKDNSALQRYII